MDTTGLSAEPRAGTSASSKPKALVTELDETAAELATADLDACSDAELSDLVVRLEAARSRLEAAQSHVVSRWDAKGVWQADNVRSGAHWLAHHCRMAKARAGRVLRRARKLRHMPHTSKAWAEGSIGIDQVDALVRARNDRVTEVFDRDEADLVEHATQFEFARFQRLLTYWGQLADPDGVEADAAEVEDQRRFHSSQTFQGAWALEGFLDPIRGSIFDNVLSLIERELFKADWADAKARHSGDVRPDLLARTPAQRRADALVEMARRAATVPKDGKAPRPLLTALVDYETLAGRICELANRTPVTPGSLLPWLTDADIERVVFDGPSRVIDVGVRRRLFVGATRRAVEARDLECTEAGCDVPADQCDIDHIVPYAKGGLTCQANGRPKCARHNPGRRRPPPRTPP